MKVLILTQFSSLGGSSRIQVLQFLPLFKEAKIDFMAKTFYSDSFYQIQMGVTPKNRALSKANLFIGLVLSNFKKILFAAMAWRYDVILIQKEVFPKLIFGIMRLLNPRVIYEIDDTIFEINPFNDRGKLEHLMLAYQAGLCLNMMKQAALVIAENEYLATEAKKHNSRVMVLSAPIDTEKYFPGRTSADGSRIIIGWMGSPSTTYMLEDIKPVFERLEVLGLKFRLKVVGARSDFSVPGIDLVKKSWSETEQLSDLQSFDIGLMPLDDSPFNRGRLGYKMIQYMSVGIPVVASNVGLNRTVIENNINGFLVDGLDEWVEKLTILIENQNVRHRLGSGGRDMAINKFSLVSKFKIFQEALDVVTRSRFVRHGKV